MATPFRSDAQITLHSVSNPTGSWAILYSHFVAKSLSLLGINEAWFPCLGAYRPGRPPSS
jgi:hypothetical protein